MEQESHYKRDAEETMTDVQAPAISTLCANNCGFFGSSATNNLYSKCYRDHFLSKSEVKVVATAVEVAKAVDEGKVKGGVDAAEVEVEIMELKGHMGIMVVPLPSGKASNLMCHYRTSSLDGSFCYWDFAESELIKRVNALLPIFVMPHRVLQLGNMDCVGENTEITLCDSTPDIKVTPSVAVNTAECVDIASKSDGGNIPSSVSMPDNEVQKEEINPFWTAVKAFVAAVVKFWTE